MTDILSTNYHISEFTLKVGLSENKKIKEKKRGGKEIFSSNIDTILTNNKEVMAF